ncbi:MAG: hypothetical protein A3J59_00535 [Candidatus Buchananbacteria bacterium RIFCSPHIGHO2_02_FULL_56_16]|uniref:Peptidyl-prolyl cis-trans isomerase n=1 Tax=Candidatus Buchananbacteria bacterium RIFCSPHIGHO2_02_FULL_56_16 TaxID=1797542 RepID=A0A1G1YFA5_9BACT|nr:MAG: hypothetical protein A3J59_00535 [Candidatus Buchananbacteria bacterium RIFCSPHIGHO2_02_FULL_56_16]
MKYLLTTTLLLALLLTGCQQNTVSKPAQPTPPPAATSQDNYQTSQNINARSQPTTMNTNYQPTPPTVEKPAFTQATITTSAGAITLELFASDAPATVNNFITLAQSGFYNGTKFHRVMQDFMIQAGDPLSKDNRLKARWGTGGPGYEFADEINRHKLVRGSLAMANAGPDTNGSQFFIVTKESTPWLDGKHTNFGRVTAGMDVVLAIEASPTDAQDRPIKDIIIEKIELK